MKTLFENIKAVIALIIVMMTYVIFMVVLFRYANDNNAVSQVIIAVVGGFGVATGYYFGYSQGSASKDNIIIDQQKQINNTNEPKA